ncbi:hypothetical protein BCR44DRAFT_1430119 [Catenaria anguillulae PL171]|uniref:Uncharacterized protein n=1 Tax=Catenaria anguillulae PL171 TaxID=765915 RepID=A0A1Y2HTL8_9FUNG|nr:hypothetical protein BCR44DRAFT_1430119 [Catenaria anguillulae PL171]
MGQQALRQGQGCAGSVRLRRRAPAWCLDCQGQGHLGRQLPCSFFLARPLALRDQAGRRGCGGSRRACLKWA